MRVRFFETTTRDNVYDDQTLMFEKELAMIPHTGDFIVCDGCYEILRVDWGFDNRDTLIDIIVIEEDY
jgi:hypothetical protein